jgi:tRNA G18 (ribose-2'-O)-methylase SpoU
MDDSRQLNIHDEFRNLTTQEITDNVKQNTLPYAIMAMNIVSDLNTSNMIRSAHLCGCNDIVIFGRKNYDRRGCVGTQNYTKITKVSAIIHPDIINFELLDKDIVDHILDVDIFKTFIDDNNYLPVFIEQDITSIPATINNIKKILIDSTKRNKKPIFIFGNETFGIPKNILESRQYYETSYTLELQQMGCIRSFNVANSCSILCYKIMEIFNEL